jgi:type I restriction enzyme S subunit
MATEAMALTGKSWLYHPEYPDHWKRCSLYSMAEWVNGLAFRDIQFSQSGMPVIKIAEIKGGISTQTKFTQQTFDESVRVRPGDLLFSWSGQPETSIDAFWWRGPEGWLNQHVFRMTPADSIDRIFFYYLLRYLRPNFVGIARNKQTTGLGHVTKRDLENIEAAYPELPEQRAIAHILGTLDDKIELNRRMNETLEAITRALFKSWFVDFEPVRAKMEGRWRKGESLPGLPARFWDLFPERLVQSELGEIPEGWEVGTLGDVADHSRHSIQPDNIEPGTPYIALEHIPKRCIALSEWSTADGLESTKFVFKRGEILFGKLRPYFHKVGVAPVDGVCSTDIVVVSPESHDWFGFVLGHISSSQFIEYTNAGSTGTKMPRTSWNDMARYGLTLPPEPTAQALNALVQPLIERMAASVHESRGLAALRDALLPKLISGEIRVTDTERFLGTTPYG